MLCPTINPHPVREWGIPAESINQIIFSGRCDWGARIRTWEWRDQNPLPYRLATPQCVYLAYISSCSWEYVKRFLKIG